MDRNRFLMEKTHQLIGIIHGDRIHDPNDDRNDTCIRIVHHLPRTTPLPQYQNSITNPCLAVIQRQEITPGLVVFHIQRLHYQKTPVFVMRMADGCDHCADYFSNNHGCPSIP